MKLERVTEATRPARQNAVLAAFRTLANVSRACAAAKVSRRQHYTWLQEDPAYAAAFDRAKPEAAQRLVDEAVERGFHGYDQPLVFQGNFTYPPLRDKRGAILRDKKGEALLSDRPLCIRRKSDSVLMFLLRAWLPKIYRERVDHEVSGSLNIVHRLQAGRDRLAKLNDDNRPNAG
jgi:hypothetical protein